MRYRGRTLHKGLYETLISEAMAAALADLSNLGLAYQSGQIASAEIPRRMAAFVSEHIERALRSTRDTDRLEAALRLSRGLSDLLSAIDFGEPVGEVRLQSNVEELRAVHAVEDSAPRRPLTPLTDTTLLTNAPGEPPIGNEIRTEIASADAIDLVLAFIRWTGIRNLIEPLQAFCDRGGRLRVLTTTYTGSTEARALDALEAAGAEIKVSYDLTSTRLHAKAWLFRRETGFSTVFIGSSNLTHSAQVTGIEWNVRASEPANAGLVDKFSVTFESYWESPQFERYCVEAFEKAQRSNAAADVDFTALDLHPRPFQQSMLDQIALERHRGHHRNLVVAATGTGKTVVAALDYRRQCSATHMPSLLFVAHRREILKQSRTVFRHAMRRGDFGELQVDGQRPIAGTHVFASVQSLHAQALEPLASDAFDVIIIDEFHHAAAASYERLLSHFQPNELLGLTATPERADGGDVFQYFDGRVAAELRLWDAMEQQLLCPFHYFGVADDTDLSTVPWRAGNYDSDKLTNVYTANDAWVLKVLQATKDVVGHIGSMRAIGFCVSIRHADFMADRFRRAGISAGSVTSQTSPEQRRAWLDQLSRGEVAILFTVDLFNEGIDIPAVDTLLMLRPTASPTVFLQQLGRGLRHSPGKDVLTVLDFVGQHRREFRFFSRYQAMLGGSRRDVERSLERGFFKLPAGCELRLDRQAEANVLANLRAAVPSNAPRRAKELREIGDVALSEYLDSAGLELADIYAGADNYWTALRRRAGFASAAVDDDEERRLGRGLKRLLHVDDEVHIKWLFDQLAEDSPPTIDGEVDRRRWHMFLVTWLSPRKTELSLEDAMALVWRHPHIQQELREVLKLRLRQGAYLSRGQPQANVPLCAHSHYARDEILAAFGLSTVAAPMPLQAGVYWHESARTQILLVTLDKTDSTFSPSTRYHDYAISEHLFHWETQGSTSVDSETGMRYLQQRGNDTEVALFCRDKRRSVTGTTAPYLYLGLADYVRHSGNRPIGITWRLRESIPGDAFAVFRAAVA